MKNKESTTDILSNKVLDNQFSIISDGTVPNTKIYLMANKFLAYKK